MEWAQQGRIRADNAISHNDKDWVPAESVPELKLEWMLSLKSGHEYGPINILAIPELYQRGKIDKTAVLENKITGQKLSAGELLRGLGRTERKDDPITSPAQAESKDKAAPAANASGADKASGEVVQCQARVSELEVELRAANDKNDALTRQLQENEEAVTRASASAADKDRWDREEIENVKAELGRPQATSRERLAQTSEKERELQASVDALQAQDATIRLSVEIQSQREATAKQKADRQQEREITRAAASQMEVLQHELRALKADHELAFTDLQAQLRKEKSEMQSRLDDALRESETQGAAHKKEQVSLPRMHAAELERVRTLGAEERKSTEVRLRARIKTLEAELAKQADKLRKEIADLEKKLAEQMKAAADDADAGGDETDWFLKLDDGATYGPAKITELIAWAAQCRIGPGQEVSTDQKNWKKVEEITELRMTWCVKLVDGTEYGPLNILSVRHLVEEDAVHSRERVSHVSGRDSLSIDDAIETEVLELMVAGRNAVREIAERDALLASAGSRIQELEDELQKVESAKLPPRSVRHFIRQD